MRSLLVAAQRATKVSRCSPVSCASALPIRWLTLPAEAEFDESQKPSRKARAKPPELPEQTKEAIRQIATTLLLPAAATAKLENTWKQMHQRKDYTPPAPLTDVQAIVQLLTSQYHLKQKDVARMYSRHPQLLTATLNQHVIPLTSNLETFLEVTPEEVGAILKSRPAVLLSPPSDIPLKLAYFRGVDLSQTHLRNAVVNNPAILTSPLDSIVTNIAFLRGSEFSTQQVGDMLTKSPRWLTLSLTALTVKWRFFKHEMKGRQADLVLWPEILDKDLINTLGPRTGFAKKKRLKLLMPSYCWRHPLLDCQKTWRESMIVPALWYMQASTAEMCKMFGFSEDEYTRYKRCWILTMGQQWRKRLYGTSMPVSEAFTLFRAGI